MGIYEDTLYTQQDQTSLYDDKLTNLYGSDKLNKLSVAKANKELQLRKDTQDYGDDSWLVQTAKEMANEFLPYEYQLTVNKDGKRYNTQNKTFNDDDLSNLWNRYQDDPEGDKVLYYLRKLDPMTGKYMYKPGIAHTSAADRYLGQIEAQGFEVIGEKRFHEASAVEKQIHGNKEFLESRVYDYGTTEEGGATDYWGSGKSELYNKDILGLDTGTSEDYAHNYQKSLQKMAGLITNDRQREDTFEFIDAFQASGVKVAGEAIKLLGEAVSTSDGDGVIEAFGKKLKADANKIAGYNPVSSREAMKGLEDSFNRGEAAGFLGNMIKGGPQWLAESLPNMAAFAGTATITTAITKNPIAGLVAGSALMGAIRANDILDTREEVMGRKATDGEIASIYAVSTALALLEYGALKYAFTSKGLIGTDAAGKSINLSKELMNTPRKRIDMALTLGTHVTKGSIAEGGEEVIAGLTEFLMENYGTETYKGVSIADMLTSEQARTTVIQSFGAGAGAGGLAGTLGKSNAMMKESIVTRNVKEEAEAKLDDIELNEAQQTKMDEFEKGSLADLTTDERVVIDSLQDTPAEQADIETSTTPEVDIHTQMQDLEQQIFDIDKQVVDDTLTAEEAVEQTKSLHDRIKELENTPEYIDNKIEELVAERDNKKGEEVTAIDEEISILETKLEEVDSKYTEHKQRIDDAIKIMKESNLSNEEIEANVKELKRVLNIAGITNTITKEDREAGLKIEFEENDPRRSEVGGVKGKTFDPIKTTNDVLQKIVDGEYDTETAEILNDTNTKITESSVAHLKHKGKSQEAIKKVANIIKEAMASGKGKTELDAISEDMTDMDILRAMTIVMSNISKNMESEKYVQGNQDIDYTRESTMLAQIGKEYLNTTGIKFAGSPESVNLAAAKIGKKLLTYAEAIELVTSEKTKVPLTEMVDAKGNKLTQRNLETQYPNVQGVSNEDGTLYVQDNALRFTDSKKKYDVEDANAVGEAMTKLANILLPTNIEIVKTEPSKEVYIDNNRPAAKGQKEMVQDIQSGGFYLKDGIRDILEQLLEEVGDMTLDEAFAKSAILKDMVGVKQSHSFLTKSSEKGQTINRKNTIRNTLDNLDKIPDGDPYYFTFKTAVNDRIHTQETMLEFQGDKRMARNVQSGGEYTTQTVEEYNELIKAIAEDLGLSKEEQSAIDEAIESGEPLPETVITHAGKDAAIDKWVKLIGERIKAGTSPMSIEDIVELNKDMGLNNSWKAYSLIKVIYDVRNRNGIKVKSDYAVQFDMSASGVFNTLMNLSGDPRVQEVLNRIINDGTDPYTILYETVLDKADKNTNAWKKLKAEVDALDAIGIDRRDLAKYLVMKWVYGAGETTNVGDMSNDLAVDVVTEAMMKYNQKAMDEINRITGQNYTGDTIHTIDKANFDTLVAYYYDNVASKFAKGLDKAFPGVAEYRTTMTNIFKALEETGTWDGTISTTIAVMNGDTDPKHKTTIKKEKATPILMDGMPIPINKMFNNMTSFFVNLQHLTDAYLNHKTFSETIKKFGNGIMTVHDAGYGNIRDMMYSKGIYDKESLDVAIKYDYVNVALMELEAAVNSMPEGTEKTRISKLLKKEQAKAKSMLEEKKKYLQGKSINMFGSKTAKSETVTESTATATTDIVEEVVETKSEVNELQSILDSINNVSEDTGTMEVIEKLEALNVSDSIKELKVKVIEGLMNGVWTVGLPGKEGKTKGYGGLNGTIYVPTADTVHPVTGKPMVADEFIEVMAHEMDHALHMEYMAENLNSPEMKYLWKVIEDLRTKATAYTKNTQERVDYILNRAISDKQAETIANKSNGKLSKEDVKKLYSIAEFVSIMRNEKSVYEEVSQKTDKPGRLMAVLQKILNAVKKWLASKSREEIKGYFAEKNRRVTFKNTAIALASFKNTQEVYDAAQKEGIELDPPSMAKPKGKSKYKQQQEVFKDAATNPDKYAEAILARSNAFVSDMVTVWGTAAVNVLSPTVKKYHGMAKRESDIYRKTMGYLKYGFVDSNTAQSMRRMFTIQSDVNDDMLGDMLTLSHNAMSEVNDYRTENLPDLVRRLAKIIKPEDQEAVYYMFSKTSLAGIKYNEDIVKGLIVDGTMTIDEAYELATKNIDAETLSKIKDLASQYVKGESKNGWLNHIQAKLYEDAYKPAIAMAAMKLVKDGQAKLDKLPVAMRKELYTMTLHNQHLSDEVHNIGVHDTDGLYREDFDGTYSMDVYDENGIDFVRVTDAQLKSDQYSSEKGWKVVKAPKNGIKGIVARNIIDGGKVPGVGININRFDNSVYLDEEDTRSVDNTIDKMSEEDANSYLRANNITKSGDSGRYKIILTEAEKAKAGVKKDVAESLWRTYAHNTELTMMKAVRDMITNSAIEKISTRGQLDALNKKIAGKRGNVDRLNKKVDKTLVEDPLPLFIKIDYNYKGYDALPAYIRRYYVTPKNLTTYGRFNEKITLVKRGEKEVLVGHSNYNPVSEDNREMRKFLYGYKKLVVMAKQKMILTNPKKLFMDAVANTGVLLAKDVPMLDVVRGIPKNLELYNEFSKLRGEIVQLEFKARLGGKVAENRVKAAKAKLRKHPFYNSYIYGHIQSYSTSMVTKDFDTISGLQKDIDDIVNSITTDKKGNPNSVHKAIKAWQNLGADNGFTVDSLLGAVSKMSKIKGTSLGEEMEAMSERLKADRDADSVARYVSQIIGGPASEAVKVGGAGMISADVISKKILADHLLTVINPKTGRLYTVEEAYREANSTFIDYRQNMPELIKGLSDYGVLLFPNFWMKAQKVVANLVYRHPASALSGYAIADMLDINSASFLDVNLITRIIEGRVINEPTSLIDWEIFSIYFGLLK